jgi:hypothetical protein
MVTYLQGIYQRLHVIYLSLLQRCTFESLNYSNFGYTQILPFDKLKISRISAKPTALLVPSMLF